MSQYPLRQVRGPFFATQLHDGDPYELSICGWCAYTARAGSRCMNQANPAGRAIRDKRSARPGC
ncbi:hypothetical protein Thiowin_05019 [Thiorhodovibrio winogradskyi]|uniref:Uncharacterized protein n=1 Tax=Thiorhodovibrio winogradskyi TaxID=77007 RepID=A0ABZ0SJ43_9GAMM